MKYKMKKSLSERFWEKVDVRGPDDCWLWTASFRTTGYGQICSNGRPDGAHRVSYEINIGPIPKGEGYHGICVCHSCDVKACCNPAHLFIGTHQDNVRDMNHKERGVTPDAIGEKNGFSRLTTSDVIEIKRMLACGGLTQKWLGGLYKVHPDTISHINTGKTWSHL